MYFQPVMIYRRGSDVVPGSSGGTGQKLRLMGIQEWTALNMI